MNTIRQLAMQWFNPLSSAEKTRLTDTTTDNIGCRRWETLTDLDIENIFYNEVIVKWYVGRYGKIEFDYNEKEIRNIYLKEHSKEEPTENYRRIALDWWETLPFDSLNTIISKRHYFEEYKSKVFTPALNYTQLTGREIQNIWAVKTETKEAERIIEQPLSVNKDVEVDRENKNEWKKNPKIGVRITEKGLPNLTYEKLGEAINAKMIQKVYPNSPSFGSKSWKVFDTIEQAEEWVKNPYSLQPKVEDNSWDEVFRLIKLETKSDNLTDQIVKSLQQHYTLTKKQ